MTDNANLNLSDEEITRIVNDIYSNQRGYTMYVSQAGYDLLNEMLRQEAKKFIQETDLEPLDDYIVDIYKF